MRGVETTSTKDTNSTNGPQGTRSKSLTGPARARRRQQPAQEATVTSGTPAVFTSSTGLRDLTLAKALAQGVRVVPGIVEVATGGASGVLTTATYGPGERVCGVGITHPTPETLAITIQVVIAASFLHPSSPLLASEHVLSPMAPMAPTKPLLRQVPITAPLQQLAAQVRVVLTDIVQRLGFSTPATIDVVIADLR